VNNSIGPEGVAGLVHGILKASSTALKNLDLRLNPLQDEGANHICARKSKNIFLFLSEYQKDREYLRKSTNRIQNYLLQLLQLNKY